MLFIWYSQINKKRNQKKFVYFGQGIAFENDFGDDFARNIVIFGVNNTASVHNRKCKNNFLMLDEGLTDDINDSVGTADKKNSITFAKSNANFSLSFHYNGDLSYKTKNCECKVIVT